MPPTPHISSYFPPTYTSILPLYPSTGELLPLSPSSYPPTLTHPPSPDPLNPSFSSRVLAAAADSSLYWKRNVLLNPPAALRGMTLNMPRALPVVTRRRRRCWCWRWRPVLVILVMLSMLPSQAASLQLGKYTWLQDLVIVLAVRSFLLFTDFALRCFFFFLLVCLCVLAIVLAV